MVRWFIVRLYALVVPLALAANAGAQTGAIAGAVTEAATSSPLEGTNLSAKSEAMTATAVTGKDGRYRFVGLPVGDYRVDVSRIGYQPQHLADVRVSSAATTTANFTLAESALSLNPVVTTETRGVTAEKVLDAPASIAVVSSEEMSVKPVALLTDYLKTLPGVSVLNGGLTQSNMVTRGFNSAFSTQMLGLQDYRFNSLPALRGNLPFLYTGTDEDIDRIEVLNGPAAAIYGPNSANGVLHIITKSPFQSQGTSVTLDGGDRSLLRAAFRTAQVFGPQGSWGAKFSGEYFTATDWPDADPNLPAVYPATAPPERAGQPVSRASLLRRFAGEARLDYRAPNGDLENTLTAGYTDILNGNEITSAFGPTEANNWSYTSLQDRVRYKRLFAQVFYNGSNSGNSSPTDPNGSFYLTTGIPIVDNSSETVYQVQQGFDLGSAKMLAGIDYISTLPRSMGTLYGRYDTDPSFGGTNITEQGAYLHSTIPLAAKLELVAAVRGDQTNRLSGSQFSPHAALVYKPDETSSFRAMFSRAFNTPIGFEYLLDQVANPYQAPGFALRAVGNPSETGWQFDRSCDASINAGLCMHSPWVAQGGTATVASSAANAFPGFIAALPGIINALSTLDAGQKAGLNGLLTQLNPILSSLHPTPSQVGTVLFGSAPIAPSAVHDLAPLQASFNNTWELGYKGIIKGRTRVALDFWYQVRGDVGTQLALVNPLVLYDPATLGSYLTASITQGLVASGQSAAQAQATAATAVAALVPFMAALPQGSLALTSRLANDQSLIATYVNGVGTFTVHGLDLALDYQANDRLLLSSTYSYQDKIVFPEIGGAANPLMSNTPKNRASASARYTNAGGLGFETTIRYADAFPVNSGYYNSLTPNVFNAAFKVLAPVPAQTQIDAGVSYRIEGLRITWSLNATNLFNDRVPNFSGLPAIGRMLLTRVKYDF